MSKRIGDHVVLPKFALLLAPMEDVSDPPFRQLCKKYGADLVYTEFISSEGLIRKASKSLAKLDIYKNERPVGIQIFGGEKESMLRAVDIVAETKPDIIDINYGCPVKKVVSKGAGAAILKDIPKMVKLTKAIVNQTNIPVTVKTRLGWDENSIHIVEVAEQLQDVGIVAISIHGRTRTQMYKGTADWKPIAAVKNNPRMHIPVFGNGDVKSPEDAKRMQHEYGLDGAMIGRAAIGNPWIFDMIKRHQKNIDKPYIISIQQRINTIETHLKKSVEWKGEKIGVLEMRRHYHSYFRNIPNIKNYKQRLMQAQTYHELSDTLKSLSKLLAVPCLNKKTVVV